MTDEDVSVLLRAAEAGAFDDVPLDPPSAGLLGVRCRAAELLGGRVLGRREFGGAFERFGADCWDYFFDLVAHGEPIDPRSLRFEADRHRSRR